MICSATSHCSVCYIVLPRFGTSDHIFVMSVEVVSNFQMKKNVLKSE